MPDPESHPGEKDHLSVGVPASRPASVQTGPSGMQTKVKMKVTLDERQRTMEGFRTVSVLAIFLAGLQAQMMSATLSNTSTLSARFINAFWLAGIFLDVFAAVLAALTARWLEVLHPPDVEFLNNTWTAEEEDIPPLKPDQSRKHRKGFIEYWVAMALFSGLGVLVAGVTSFFVGLMIFIWTQQPLLVSIIGTIPCVLLTPLVGCLFIPHVDGRRNIIEILARKKGNW